MVERADNMLEVNEREARERQMNRSVFLLMMNGAIYSTEQAVTKGVCRFNKPTLQAGIT